LDYISVKQAAEKWGISVRWVQTFLKNNRIPGATRINGYAWLIPADAEKPGDPRFEQDSAQEKNKKTLVDDLSQIIDITIVPMPNDNPDSILDITTEDRLRLHFEGELAYLRGDFDRVIRCFHRTNGDNASRLRACSLTVAAAISTGNYALYTEIETYLKGIIKENIGENIITNVAELALDTAYVSTIAPNMASHHLKNGNFNGIPSKMKLDAVYKRVKYFQCVRNFEAMLTAAQTALTFCDSNREIITYADIYLRLSCAIACCSLGNTAEAERYLAETLKICLPHGFITPFAESATAFGGLLERCVEHNFPEHYSVIIKQWKRTFTNWISFHNLFTKDNVSSVLSLRNYEIATLVARRVPYSEIAKNFNISVGRLNNIVREIYDEFLISSKKELAKFIL